MAKGNPGRKEEGAGKKSTRGQHQRSRFRSFIPMLGLLIGVGVFLVLPHIAKPLVFLHWVRPPLSLFPLDVVDEERFTAVRVSTEDGETLGAWIYHFRAVDDDDLAPEQEPYGMEDYRTVVLYCHGNAGTRGQGRRVRSYDYIAQAFPGAALVTFDYRGYGDSTGSPSQEGLVKDVTAMYNFVVTELGAETVYVHGHSLGSGVASQFALAVSEGTIDVVHPERFAALFLEAPFTSIRDAAESHFVASPLWLLPRKARDSLFSEWIKLEDEFLSIEALPRVRMPVLIMHGDGDWIIDVAQGRRLYDVACGSQDADPSVPPVCDFYGPSAAGHNSITHQEDYPGAVAAFLERVHNQ